MRSFSQLAEEQNARFPMQHELWTFYHLETSPYQRCSFDWGMCLAYHFDRGTEITAWLDLANQVKDWIESQPDLAEVVRFVPFYEIGTDFLTQCKPPYDGGYSTEMYDEFLHHGSCEPAPWFFEQLASLHVRVVDALRDSSTKGTLLSRIIHATLIKPYTHLFWLDEEGWALYQPSISVEDVRQWQQLGKP